MVENIQYRVGDALTTLESEPSGSTDCIHLDDAWARPNRNGGMGVAYETHPVDEGSAELVESEPGVTTELTVEDFLAESLRILRSGGLLIVDTDDYLLPNVLSYLSRQGHDRSYRVGQITALTKDGEPDKSTPGMYGSTGGYASVLVWKDACPLPAEHPVGSHNLHCPCERQRESYGRGTVKPLDPYKQWLDEYTVAGDRIVVPCAGTAPAAIAAEDLYGEDVDVLCVDIEDGAKEAYEERRIDELNRQSALGEFF